MACLLLKLDFSSICSTDHFLALFTPSGALRRHQASIGWKYESNGVHQMERTRPKASRAIQVDQYYERQPDQLHAHGRQWLVPIFTLTYYPIAQASWLSMPPV
eukprot:scaffold20967_cov24-Tisochrysis_lutea.AAC.5